MQTELLDRRLAEVMPANEYLTLKAQAERAFASIQAKAPTGVAADVADLVHIMRLVEERILDQRLGEKDASWAQGSMATLA